MGVTKLGRFLHKNQHTQKKLLYFENWKNGGLRNFQKIDEICNLWQYGLSKGGIQNQIDFWPKINILLKRNYCIL